MFVYMFPIDSETAESISMKLSEIIASTLGMVSETKNFCEKKKNFVKNFFVNVCVCVCVSVWVCVCIFVIHGLPNGSNDFNATFGNYC